MKNEEAIKILQVAKAEIEWSAPLDYQEALDMAIEELEKQIPKKFIRDIKPCPFCGGRAKLVFIPGDYGYTENMYKVECTKCGASIIRSEKCVNDAWNRRVGDEG